MTKVIDNFDKLAAFLPDKADPDVFWSVRIIGRKKDNPELEKNSKLYDTFTVACKDDLERLKSRITKISTDNRARAYFNPTAKSWKKVALQSMRELAVLIGEEDYSAVRRLVDHVIDSGCNTLGKIWVIDIDDEQSDKDTWSVLSEMGVEIIERIPTLNGVHFLTRPFNLDEFNKKYPEKRSEKPEVKKNNPTLLYFNKHWED